MSEAATAVTVDSQPTTKQKIALGTTNVLIGIAVTVAASYVTTQLQNKAEKLIIPQKKES
jgi:hypothetical protein